MNIFQAETSEYDKICIGINNATERSIASAIEDRQDEVNISNLNQAFDDMNKAALEKVGILSLEEQIYSTFKRILMPKSL